MEYVIHYQPGEEICNIVVTGEIKRPVDSIQLQALCFEHGAKNNCQKYIVDMRDTTVTGSMEDSYIAGVSPGIKGVEPSMYRGTLVYPRLLPEHRVMQTVLSEQGYDIQILDDMDLATDWLNRE